MMMMQTDHHLDRMRTIPAPLPRLVFDQPPAVAREVDDICQRGITAALSYIAAGRAGRALMALTRAELAARRRLLDLQAEAFEDLVDAADPGVARLRQAMQS